MDIERIKSIIKSQDGLSNTLGMEFISTPEPDTCMARMIVDERNRQPYGFLPAEPLWLWLRISPVWPL